MTDDPPTRNKLDQELEHDRQLSEDLGKAIDKAEAEAERRAHHNHPDQPHGGGVI